MGKKIVKLSENDLSNMIDECVNNFIYNKNDKTLYENFMNNIEELGKTEPQFAETTSDDDTFVDFDDGGADYEDEFAHQLMDLCVEGSSLFSNIADTIRENDYKNVKKYNLERVLGKVENICELINEIWKEND